MFDFKENLPPFISPPGDNPLIKNSCASSLQSQVNDEQVISLKKQLKQQANEFASAKALWGQRIELLTKENEEFKIREGHLKMMNESLLNLWNEFNDSNGKTQVFFFYLNFLSLIVDPFHFNNFISFLFLLIPPILNFFALLIHPSSSSLASSFAFVTYNTKLE